MKSSKLTPVVRIVDDDEKVLASEAFLVNMAGFRTSTYNSAKEFLEKDDPLFPGCVILDIRMPEMSGLQLQEEMKKRELDLPIIFLTGHGDIDMAVKALLTGATDFIVKPPEPNRLKEALAKAVAKNQSDREASETCEEMRAQFDLLTPAEKKAAEMIALGKLNKVISFELEVSEQAVKNWRSSIFHKLNCKNIVELNAFLRKIHILNDYVPKRFPNHDFSRCRSCRSLCPRHQLAPELRRLSRRCRRRGSGCRGKSFGTRC